MSLFLVVIVGQSQLFREGLGQLLRSTQFTVIGSARSFSQLVPLQERPDLVICGFDRETDLEEQFRNVSCARVGSPVPRMVILTDLSDAELLSRAMGAEIDAVLSKDISSEVLQRSLELVMLGQSVFPSAAMRMPVLGGVHGASSTRADLPAPPPPTCAIPAQLVRHGPEIGAMKPRLGPHGHRHVPLSDREDQILAGLVAGAPNKAIARDLGITEGTVKVHVKSLLRKLGATNRTQAAIWGIDRGALLRGSATPHQNVHAADRAGLSHQSIDQAEAVGPRLVQPLL